MKLVLMCALLLPALAGAEPTPQPVTGSHIPRETRRIGRTTDTVAPLYVIDRSEIERSGATTVSGVLRRVPFAYPGRGR